MGDGGKREQEGAEKYGCVVICDVIWEERKKLSRWIC